jgi:hypothetical protein
MTRNRKFKIANNQEEDRRSKMRTSRRKREEEEEEEEEESEEEEEEEQEVHDAPDEDLYLTAIDLEKYIRGMPGQGEYITARGVPPAVVSRHTKKVRSLPFTSTRTTFHHHAIPRRHQGWWGVCDRFRPEVAQASVLRPA